MLRGASKCLPVAADQGKPHRGDIIPSRLIELCMSLGYRQIGPRMFATSWMIGDNDEDQLSTGLSAISVALRFSLYAFCNGG